MGSVPASLPPQSCESAKSVVSLRVSAGDCKPDPPSQSEASTATPYEFIGLGGLHGPRPHEFIGFGDLHGPKPYKFIGFGDEHTAPTQVTLGT